MRPSTESAFIGLGANLGDARAALEVAVKELAALPDTALGACSSIWRSAPIDSSGPDYLNAVARVETTLGPRALLAAMQRIELAHGRERPYRNAPRTLDLDLVLYGESVIDEPGLIVPHPRLHERAFVLRPLAEIAPDLRIPGRGRLAGLLADVAGQRIERLMDPTVAAGLKRFRHIVIEGPIGVGKSSLARRLAAELGAELLLELPEENPFLDRFYDDMPGYAFQTQLFFLFQRVKQMQSAAQPGMFETSLVGDFLFAKDALFARLTLSDDEFRLYSQMYAQSASQVREPDLVIWLQATPATLLARIRNRAIGMEQGIDVGYLQRLCDAYVEFFQGYEGAPVLAVGTEHFNPIDSEDDFQALLQRVAAFQGRREFFNSAVDIPFG